MSRAFHHGERVHWVWDYTDNTAAGRADMVKEDWEEPGVF